MFPVLVGKGGGLLGLEFPPSELGEANSRLSLDSAVAGVPFDLVFTVETFDEGFVRFCPPTPVATAPKTP